MEFIAGFVIVFQFMVIIGQYKKNKELDYRNDYVLKQHRKKKGLPL